MGLVLYIVRCLYIIVRLYFWIIFLDFGFENLCCYNRLNFYNWQNEYEYESSLRSALIVSVLADIMQLEIV